MVVECSGSARMQLIQLTRIVRDGVAERRHEAERQNSARSVTAENYSDVGSFGDTKAINCPPSREADWATTLTARAARPIAPYPTRPFGGW